MKCLVWGLLSNYDDHRTRVLAAGSMKPLAAGSGSMDSFNEKAADSNYVNCPHNIYIPLVCPSLHRNSRGFTAF